MNKRNTPFAESIMNCGATFLNPDTTPSLCYSAAKQFVDEYEREQRHQRQACKPKVGEVYRDIFGNRYLIISINDEEPDKKSFVTLIYFNASGDLRSSELFTVPLEDFMNPTFKKA